jgi:hypothetical protein
MPNRIPTPGIPSVGVRSDAVDNRHINTAQHGTIGGKTKTPAKAQGPINFNKTVGHKPLPKITNSPTRDKMIGKAQDTLMKSRLKGGTYDSSGTN